MEKRSIGNNVEANLEGDLLTITIDLSKTLGASKSGKSKLIASTNGNAILAGGVRIGINAYRPA